MYGNTRGMHRPRNQKTYRLDHRFAPHHLRAFLPSHPTLPHRPAENSRRALITCPPTPRTEATTGSDRKAPPTAFAHRGPFEGRCGHAGARRSSIAWQEPSMEQTPLSHSWIPAASRHVRVGSKCCGHIPNAPCSRPRPDQAEASSYMNPHKTDQQWVGCALTAARPRAKRLATRPGKRNTAKNIGQAVSRHHIRDMY
jgi:hypothetical protein